MQSQKYIRFEYGDKEYYDLAEDPYEIRSKPDSVDEPTRSYWEQRLDTLQNCEESACRTAENAPALPNMTPSVTP